MNPGAILAGALCVAFAVPLVLLFALHALGVIV
jgi:hypothetical protein